MGLRDDGKGVNELQLLERSSDKKSVLPNWNEGEYHEYQSMTQLLHQFDQDFPDYVQLFSIGRSVLGRDLWCIRITNEYNDSRKLACVIDGCIHGNEWESAEACLYLAEYLLINAGDNKSILDVLNCSEVYIIPLLNPDGRQRDDRFNENSVDLNRNFDVHFGRIAGGSLPLGSILGKKISYIKRPGYFEKLSGKLLFKRTLWTNSGRNAFSEPESRALRDFMESIEKDLSFYVNCHTAVHVILPPIVIKRRPEYTIRDEQHQLFDQVKNWCEKHTEYGMLSSTHTVPFGGGLAHHWVFKRFLIPSFCFEILSREYEPGMGQGKHDHRIHWMKTTLPFFMYLLMNIESLSQWNNPDINPFLPEGVPPEPLSSTIN